MNVENQQLQCIVLLVWVTTGIILFYQVSYIMFFEVLTNYLCSLSKNHILSEIS